jgi:hypothetical protein
MGSDVRLASGLRLKVEANLYISSGATAQRVKVLLGLVFFAVSGLGLLVALAVCRS